jgi:hypothetical protein
MLHWYAIHKDKPQSTSHTEERAPRASVIRRFDGTAVLSMHDGRAVIGMWLIDDATAPGDVVRCHGTVAREIVERNLEYLARVTATN